MQLSARASLPYLDEARAVSGLHGDLREQAARHNHVPDWATLQVTGPEEAVGAYGRVWYRWAAVVQTTSTARRAAS
jgi:hypothetical protein